MPQLVEIGDAIEGAKLEATAREELRHGNRGSSKRKGVKQYYFSLTRDVIVSITQELAEGSERILPHAHTGAEFTLVCMRAGFYTEHRRPPAVDVVPRSATHKANQAIFSGQTAAMIEIPKTALAAGRAAARASSAAEPEEG